MSFCDFKGMLYKTTYFPLWRQNVGKALMVAHHLEWAYCFASISAIDLKNVSPLVKYGSSKMMAPHMRK